MARQRGLKARLRILRCAQDKLSPIDWATFFLAVGAALAAMVLAR